MNNRKKILVVDDEKSIREILKRFCQYFGYEPILCEHAGQAIHRIAEADLVITDFLMPPGMDGAQLAKIIKTEKNGTPVIILTGTPQEVPNDHPADILIGKPFQLKRLRETIENLLSRF